MLPTIMQEQYVVRDVSGSSESIDGEAKYSNPRQFRVSTEAKAPER